MSKDGYLPPGVEYSDIPGIDGPSTRVSNCCGAEDVCIPMSDIRYSDTETCPECGEHCTFVDEDEIE